MLQRFQNHDRRRKTRQQPRTALRQECKQLPPNLLAQERQIGSKVLRTESSIYLLLAAKLFTRALPAVLLLSICSETIVVANLRPSLQPIRVKQPYRWIVHHGLSSPGTRQNNLRVHAIRSPIFLQRGTRTSTRVWQVLPPTTEIDRQSRETQNVLLVPLDALTLSLAAVIACPG